MFSKILITLIVIFTAAILLKRRSEVRVEQNDSTYGVGSEVARIEQENFEGNSEIRFAAYLFLVLMLGVGGFLYIQDWQDKNTIITVSLYREGTSNPIVYKAKKGDLGARSFTTLDGIQVLVASDERMELSGF